jgi:hypothetical protein
MDQETKQSRRIKIAAWFVIVGIFATIASAIAIFYVLEYCPLVATDFLCRMLNWRSLPVVLGHAGFALLCWGASYLSFTATRKAYAEGRGGEDPAQKLPWLIRITPFAKLARLTSPVMGWLWTYTFFMTGLTFAFGAILLLAGIDYRESSPPK